MAPDVVISARGVTKRYAIYARPADMLRELVTGRPRHREFSALEDVSFEVRAGEAMGIMGRNGAGKSTLLRIVAGTLEATSGRVELSGRVAAILELGAGFHLQYTGRENVVLGGMCMGMSEREVRGKLDSIIDFAELREFVDQPLRTYSTGMLARLAFSVVVAVDPRILIVDEALAVGDARFALKCADKFREFRREGRTILLVSHSSEQVTTMCDRAILLERGRLIESGPAAEVTRRYHRLLFGGGGESKSSRSTSAAATSAAIQVESTTRVAEPSAAEPRPASAAPTDAGAATPETSPAALPNAIPTASPTAIPTASPTASPNASPIAIADTIPDASSDGGPATGPDTTPRESSNSAALESTPQPEAGAASVAVARHDASVLADPPDDSVTFATPRGAGPREPVHGEPPEDFDPGPPPSADELDAGTRMGTGSIRIERVAILDARGRDVRRLAPNASYVALFEAVSADAHSDLSAGFLVRDRSGQTIFGIDTRLDDGRHFSVAAGERFRVAMRFVNNLGPGEHFLSFGVAHADGTKLDYCYDAVMFDAARRPGVYHASRTDLLGVPVVERHASLRGTAQPG